MNYEVCFLVRCPEKKSKKYTKDKGLLGWEDMTMWRDFQPLHVLEGISDAYIHYMMSKSFLRWS